MPVWTTIVYFLQGLRKSIKATQHAYVLNQCHILAQNKWLVYGADQVDFGGVLRLFMILM